MSFSGIGIGLSVVFGFLLLAIIAQLYYLLWRKRRRTHAEIGNDESNYKKKMLDGACWKSLSSLQITTKEPETKILEADVELGGIAETNKDLVMKHLGEDSVEAELMRLHNLAGPPRFLFTIKEETKEDLESEDGKSRKGSSRTRSLSDLMVAIDAPFLTPLPSSPLKSSPLTSLDSYKHQGFNNPLFESFSEPEIHGFRSSPPPKFKFLRDAEEKLYRRLIEEAHKRAQSNQGSVSESGVKDSPNTTIDERDGSFLRLIKNREKDQKDVQQHQVLPLASSPTTTLRPLEKESMVR